MISSAVHIISNAVPHDMQYCPIIRDEMKRTEFPVKGRPHTFAQPTIYRCKYDDDDNDYNDNDYNDYNDHDDNDYNDDDGDDDFQVGRALVKTAGRN